jgi:Domain of unknown function (DUF4260)
MFKPKFLLHLEGAVVLFAACVCFHHLHGSWLWFALLILTPDFFMLAYLANKSLGAALYNLGHTYTAPPLLISGLLLAGQGAYVWLGLIWLAHIGADRMFGYGLKYQTAFKDTHLQRV